MVGEEKGWRKDGWRGRLQNRKWLERRMAIGLLEISGSWRGRLQERRQKDDMRRAEGLDGREEGLLDLGWLDWNMVGVRTA